MDVKIMDVKGQTVDVKMTCSICLDTMETPFYMKQCTHCFHGACVMKAFETYLALHGTEWQTVPCPMCRKRISYHIMLRSFIETCTLEDAEKIINGANLHVRCHLEMSLLHVAAEAGNFAMVRYLIGKGLRVEDTNCFGLTPVYFAAVHGKTETVRYLVETCGANTRIKNMFGQTMLDMVMKQKKYPETITYLNSIGAGNLRFPQGACGAQGLSPSGSDPCDPSLKQ